MPDTTPGTNAKILKIEKEVLIAAYLANWLKGLGYKVVGKAVSIPVQLEKLAIRRVETQKSLAV